LVQLAHVNKRKKDNLAIRGHFIAAINCRIATAFDMMSSVMYRSLSNPFITVYLIYASIHKCMSEQDLFK
jgi:hypothetical protein